MKALFAVAHHQIIQRRSDEFPVHESIYMHYRGWNKFSANTERENNRAVIIGKHGRDENVKTVKRWFLAREKHFHTVATLHL